MRTTESKALPVRGAKFTDFCCQSKGYYLNKSVNLLAFAVLTFAKRLKTGVLYSRINGGMRGSENENCSAVGFIANKKSPTVCAVKLLIVDFSP
ncbi:hypothetical protein J2X32_001766 [Rheinheimera pacifica]|uniref:hypothetical protein n=1 Tax=Rheinheimera pacifica TaxID=173990 RepID=UPI00285D33C9|nr:hypothetical protein [Rheinheimera pacifica]MDR6983132.1 hypothetical protein [Rheinheimera pacifica]